MKKFAIIPLIASLLLVAGCSSTPTPTPTPTPTTPTTPTTPVTTTTSTPISPVTLALIQTGATVATGAVLDFAVTQAATRTKLANEIYSSANAIYTLTGGTAPTPAQLNSTLTTWGVTGDSQYTGYVTAISSLYATYYQKFTSGSITATDISSVLNAIASGAEAATQSYVTTPAPTAAVVASLHQ